MKNLFVKLASLVSLLSVIAYGSFAVFAVPVNSPYLFYNTMTDSLGTTFQMRMSVEHSGQTFLYVDNYSYFSTGSTVPTNDDVSLNISAQVRYQRESNKSSFELEVWGLHIGYAHGTTLYEVSLPSKISVDTTRVTINVNTQAQISKGDASQSGSFSSSYTSPVTNQIFYMGLTKSREDIIEHGHDYAG